MKTAVITGVSGGIGSQLAKTYLSEGYFVIGQYNRGKDRIEELEKELLSKGLAERFFAVQSDFSVDGKVQEFCDTVLKNVKSVSVLICNAGIDTYKLLTDTTEREFQDIFNVNVRSAFLLCKYLLPKMQSNCYGRIIFISSIWGVKGACMESLYSASKFALIGMAKSLAQEVASNQITVNCICPGVVDTPMNSAFTKEEMTQIISSTPIGRVCSPQEVAKLALYLSSDDAGFITGESIVIDGGFTL